ncbi:uncharacterized protein LOC101849039 [Aplysia californica]|uniref:Uncharacterized protein LOC101849039 n=1 Tax=Aplysia californica TaxID=6500 RepID=A0ABM0JIN2_APLCA|nr:uncharacterized protein LOC101849039 [Aplysia californica]XP_005094513.2 uncharacterized protein LOC101849039 [Aplysia californica]
MTSRGSSGGRSRHDKEMSAVTFNLKEQRVLEKSLQTLKLEESYALKLLELDNKVIKVRYRKLKDRVSRIKSHLPADDINKFRELDAKGKMKPLYGNMSLSSAIKIAAASRRLNLNSSQSSGRRAIRSALPRISVQQEDNNANQLRSKSSVSFAQHDTDSGRQRSNSVTGAFIDAPERKTQQRPVTAFVSHISTKGRSKCKTPTPKDDFEDVVARANGLTVENNKHFLAIPSEDGLERSRTAPIRSVSAYHRGHSPFSSHVTSERDSRWAQSASLARAKSRGRRLSHVSMDSIDSNLGESASEERRQELLEEEGVRAAVLSERTKLFLQDVEDYLLQHPPLTTGQLAFEEAPPTDPTKRSATVDGSRGLVGNDRPLRLYRRIGRPGETDDTPTFLPEEDYKQRLLSLWKDMNKCRYLRMPDEKIDLSGINTLVKDQMKLFQTLKNQDPAPLTELQLVD